MIQGIAKRILNMILPLSVMYRAPTSESKVVLTFDDGPHPDYTPGILKALSENNATATFFVLGEQAEKYPDLVRQIKEQGHELASHGYHHFHANEVGSAEEKKNAIKAHVLLHKEGFENRFYRPPYGEITVKGLLSLLWNGYMFIFWSWDSEDSNEDDPEAFSRQLQDLNIRAGDILLFHEDYKHTVDELPGFIQRLRSERDLECVSLGKLLGEY